ncbi:MAG: VWA domain-containing protein [Truepera sp.]|nr:VWA domain-containing protein [Truepera sp.]
MSFAAPAWFFLLLLAPVIVLLHMRRRRLREVGSILLWRQVAALTEPQSTWRRPTLNTAMLLQLLALLLLTLALVEPQPRVQLDPRPTVVLLDASASMAATTGGGETRFQQAIKHVERLAHSTPRLSLIWVGDHPRFIPERRSDPREFGRSLSRLEPGAGRANWDRAADLVRSLGEEPRLLVISDDPATPVEHLRNRLLEAEAVTVGESAPNRSLQRVEVRPRNEGGWLLTGSVRSHDFAGGVELEVSFQPYGSDTPLLWAETDFEVPASGDTPFEIAIDVRESGLLTTAIVGEDALSSDDSHIVFLDPERVSARVLLLGPRQLAVEQAFEAVEGVTLFWADSLPEDITSRFDLVVVQGIALDRSPEAPTLYLGTSPPGSQPLRILRGVEVSMWRDDHPLTEGTAWDGLLVEQALELPRLGGARVLLAAGEAPLIQVRVNEYGPEAVVAFTPDTSNWDHLVSFPTFLLNLLGWLRPDLPRLGAGCRVGSACPLPVAQLALGAQLLTPADRPFRLPPSAASTFTPEERGLYQLEGPQETFRIAVNGGDSSGDLSMAGADSSADLPTGQSTVPFRAWLLAIATGVLVLESILAGRGEARFLRPSALAPGYPQAGQRWTQMVLLTLALLLIVAALFQVPLLLPERSRHLVLVKDGGLVETSDPRWERLEDRLQSELRGARLTTLILPGEGFGGLDLETGLRLAEAEIPQGAHGRIIVAGRNGESRGDALGALPLLQERGLSVDVLPLSGRLPGDLVVVGLSAAGPVYAGSTNNLVIRVVSEVEQSATLSLLRDGELQREESVGLVAGGNIITLPIREAEAGTYHYVVELASPGDPQPENNRVALALEVYDRLRVAMYTPVPERGELFAQALALQGIEAVVQAPHLVPYTADGFDAWGGVILMNVPAIDLHTLQQEAIEAFVRDWRGGVLLLGGENTFGPGGYFQTPLERLSPLSSRIPREAPEVTMLFILDRSGSMQQRVGASDRLGIAKAATLSATELLNERSQIGVIVFDEQAQELVPLQPAGDREALAGLLEPLVPGGGTSLYPALVRALDRMREVESAARHIVVMSDGLSQPGDFEAVLAELRSLKVTVSTVGIGQGADVERLETIARLGGGAFHATDDFQALPGILSQEALLLSASPVHQETVTPVWQKTDTSFSGNLPTRLPALGGFVETTAKEEAQVSLTTADGDPLLASWRYGLGRVVAFSPQAAGPWSEGWIALEGYPRIWAQIARWAFQEPITPGLNVDTTRRGDELFLDVIALDSKGQGLTDLDLIVEVERPDSVTEAVALLFAGNATYRGMVPLDAPGVYRLRVFDSTEGSNHEIDPVEFSLNVQAPAIPFILDGGELLEGLAAGSGGRLLGGEEQLFQGPTNLRWLSRPSWRPWALLGLALFLIALVLRYTPHLLLWRRPRTSARPLLT